MTRQEREQAEENRRALLRAEAVLLALLLRRRNEATTIAVAGGYSLGAAADVVRARVRSGVLDGRAESSRRAERRVTVETAALGLTLGGAATLADAARESRRAHAAARSYAERWAQAAREAEAPTLRAAAQAAGTATRGALRRIAATESSEAYTAARLRTARRLDPDLVQRVWDAELDKRTCPVCAHADGTIVGLRERFPDGEPGSVHPFCRCTFSLVTIYDARRNAA